MGIFKRKSKWEGIDALDLIPAHRVEFEVDADSQGVTLHIPRFREPFIGPLMQRLLPPDRKCFRVPLEDRGSRIWLHMDGKTPVRALVAKIQGDFPGGQENIHERVSIYIMSLYQNNFISFINLE